MSIGEAPSYLSLLTSMAGYAGQVESVAFYPPRAAVLDRDYAGAHAAALRTLAVVPYAHQARAFRYLGADRNVVLATPTASGKSLVYQLPTLDALGSGGSSLFLFPTKALAHDQLGRLSSLAERLGVQDVGTRIGTFDGDTRTEARRQMRDAARCVLTNPDMLHYGLLPFHSAWSGFLRDLRFVVLDELHAYRGVLGIHVANVLRRLLRVARLYGAEPRIIAASATIGNPKEHAVNLTGAPFELVDADDAPKGPREFIVWRPTALPNAPDRRRSATTEAAKLAVALLRADVKSLFFTNSRKTAELLRRYAAADLDPEEAPLLQSYRAGYSSEERRLIEDGFRDGAVRVLSTTSALELGMDIGGVDAVVLVGYPGSKMAMWQRAGRAGRAGRRSLTLLIPGNDPLDSYFLQHPEALTEGPVEDAVADAFNVELHPLHAACAAAEAPIEDAELDPPSSFATWLEPGRVPGIHRIGGRWVHPGRYPHRHLRLRGMGGGRVRLRDGLGRTLGSADLATALRELHPGAVYLHRGEQYLVLELDLERGVASLVPHIEDYFTRPRSDTDVEVLETFGGQGSASLAPPPSGVQVGRVRVTNTVHSYVRQRYFGKGVLDERPLDLPELSYATQALWFGVGSAAHGFAPDQLAGAIHALEHTLIGLLPAFVLCERADVGGVSYPLYPPAGETRVFIYDGYPGGVGYARAGAAVFLEWLRAARDLLSGCPCKDGCPRCVFSPKCGNGNQMLDKRAAARLADALLLRMSASASPVVRA